MMWQNLTFPITQIALAIVWLMISVASFAQTTNSNIVIQGQTAKVTVSSQLNGPKQDPTRYHLNHLFDGNTDTAWVEGEPGINGPHTISIHFHQPVALNALGLLAGYHKSAKLFAANAVPRQLTVTIDGQEFQDKLRYQQRVVTDKEHAQTCHHADTHGNLAPKLFVLPQPRKVQHLKITIDTALQGTLYDDVVISELMLLGPDFTATPSSRSHRLTKITSQLQSLRHSPWAKQKIPAYFVGYQSSGWQLASWEQITETTQTHSHVQTQWTPIEDYLDNRSLLAAHFFHSWLDLQQADEHITVTGKTAMEQGDGEWIQVSPAMLLASTMPPNSAHLTPMFLWQSFQASSPGCHGGLATKNHLVHQETHK